MAERDDAMVHRLAEAPVLDVVCDCALVSPTMPTCRGEHLPTCSIFQRTEEEFWTACPLRYMPISVLVYGRRGLTDQPSTQGNLPIRVEYVPAHELYLVHDGRHRIEQAKRNGQTTIIARVA